MQVLATTEDANLGGRDFDRILSEHFADEFKVKYKIDARTKPRAYIRLMQECEKLKKLMSANTTKIPINIECFMEDKDVTGAMAREAFEGLASDLIQRADATIRSVLDAASKWTVKTIKGAKWYENEDKKGHF